MKWLVEFDGKQKPLEDVTDPRLQAAVDPVREFLVSSLAGSADELTALSIVFFVDPETGLKFSFRGPPAEVNLARELVGPQAEITPSRN